jgi:hypothetical protein
MLQEAVPLGLIGGYWWPCTCLHDALARVWLVCGLCGGVCTLFGLQRVWADLRC